MTPWKLFSLAVCAVILSSAWYRSICQTSAPDPGNDRPHLRRQTGKLNDYDLPKDSSVDRSNPLTYTGPSVAPGLNLPNMGMLWALDHFQGNAELVHLRYRSVKFNGHLASNILKEEAMPIFYKPKFTIEVKGTAAAIRLHDPSAIFFLRGTSGNDAADAAAAAQTQGRFALIQLKVDSDKRVAATIAFTQYTWHASRKQSAFATLQAKLPGTSWYKISPGQPLPPGEYGFMFLPERQGEYSPTIFDFAIDPNAPENPEVVSAISEKSE